MAKRIDDYTVQQIKDAANIVEVIGDFFNLKKAGVNYWCLCPFHDDRHAGSFVVRPPGIPQGNVYRCFACDAKGGPIEFLMNYKNMTYRDALLYLAQKYGIYIDDDQKKVFENVKPAEPKDVKVVGSDLPVRTWPVNWVKYYRNLDNDNFVQWLRQQNWDEVQRARLPQVLRDYMVGHTQFATQYHGDIQTHDWTLWWMVDAQGILHNCHLMKYLPNGHRDKLTEYNQTWLHARMKYVQGQNHFDGEREQASYCLFGLHLLNRYPTAVINLVESEKTAVIMATAYGNHAGQIWMACAGLQNLKRERLQPLIDQGRTIEIFPDRDGIAKWVTKATALDYKRLRMNITAVTEWWQPQDGEKADIADVVLRIINEKQKRNG